MYYILNPNIRMCGYKGLPFGLFNSRTGETDFFDREQYELVLMLDGNTEVVRDSLTEKQQRLFDRLTELEFIHSTEEPASLAENQKYRSYPAMFKRDVQWSITGACNYRCRHCFMSAPDCRFTEPTREQCIDTVRQFAECGIKTVSLTGGETLVSPWFYDILDECAKNGIVVSTIYSNGALVTEELIEELKKRNMKPAFHISFDGIGWHDWIRGIDGAEEAAVNAFRLLKKYGFAISSSMCLHRHNLEGLNETIRFLDSLGLSHLKTNIASPAGLWANETEHFLNADETYAYLLETVIPQYLKDDLSIGVQFCGLLDYVKGKRCVIPFSKFSGEESALSQYACGAVKNGMYVSPEGYVLPCMTMVGTAIQDQFPSMRDTSLSEILSGSSYTKASMALMEDVVGHNEECGKCVYRLYCGGGCRACPEDEKCTDYYAIDKTTCSFFKNGWFEKAQALVKTLTESAAAEVLIKK